MRLSWLPWIATCLFAVSWSQGPQAAEPAGRVAAARLRAAIQQMRAEGKSDGEILKAVEGILDRVAVASKAPGRPMGPPPEAARIRQRIQAAVQTMRAEGKSPEEIQAAVMKMKQNAMELLRKNAKPAKADKAPAKKEPPKKAPPKKEPVKAKGEKNPKVKQEPKKSTGEKSPKAKQEPKKVKEPKKTKEPAKKTESEKKPDPA